MFFNSKSTGAIWSYNEGLPTASVSYDFLAGFGLSKTSLAIDTGSKDTISEMPLVDFQNTTLNAGSMLDIGTFESSATLAVNKYTENKKACSVS